MASASVVGSGLPSNVEIHLPPMVNPLAGLAGGAAFVCLLLFCRAIFKTRWFSSLARWTISARRLALRASFASLALVLLLLLSGGVVVVVGLGGTTIGSGILRLWVVDSSNCRLVPRASVSLLDDDDDEKDDSMA